MTLQRALFASTKLLTCITFSALAATGKLPHVLVITGFLSLAVSMGQEWRGAEWLKVRPSPIAWNSLLMAACLATVVDFFWGTQNALQASLYVLVFLMINKLLVMARLKDIPQLFAIGFMKFLAAAVLTVDLWYAVAFVVYLLTAIWALLLYHMSCETLHHIGADQEAGLSVVPVPFTRRFFWTTNVVALLALTATSSIFMVMPRTGFGFFQKAEGAPIRTSGFSEKVDLGVIGAIKQDPTLVMRVQFPDVEGEPTERVYMRGASFDHYTGQSWINTFSRRRIVAKNDDGIFEIVKPHTRLRAPRMNQEILMEALDISVLFGLPFPADIRGPFASIETDAMGGLWLPQTSPGRLQYNVTSVPHYVSREDRESDLSQYPSEGASRFLQLPPMHARVYALARAITRETTTPYAMTMAIKQHLLTHYRYTLDVGMEQSDDPLDDFLFTRKTGYCEHYATAMVILLRSLGIPARLVTGFLASEWNNFGHYYAVRQQDAHAWVEVWFPRSGWITFDPTPGVVTESAPPFFKQVGSIVDSIRLKWDRFVIHYSFYDQMAVANGLKRQGETARDSVSEGVVSLKKWIGSARSWAQKVTDQLAIGVALSTGAFILWVRMRSRRNVASSQKPSVVQMYEQMLQILRAQGFEKPSTFTAHEFCLYITRKYPLAGPIVQTLTELYYRSRFGHEPFSPHDLQHAEDLFAELIRLSDPKISSQ